MTSSKLKGIVRDGTLTTILYQDAIKTVWLPKGESIVYFTRKSKFVAKRKSVKYWNVFQLLGDV